jgi:hypothetical protein
MATTIVMVRWRGVMVRDTYPTMIDSRRPGRFHKNNANETRFQPRGLSI